MKEIIELRPDRDLIDTDFAGYKLSLDSIPTYEKNLEIDVDTVKLSNSQYSFAHVEVFTRHNHLFINPCTPNLAYFIDESWNIMQVTIGSLNNIQSLIKVGEIPVRRQRKPGDFPVSVYFASKDRAVIGDGAGAFHVAAVKPGKWMIVFYDTIVPEDSMVVAARQEEDKLHILTRAIVEPKFESRLQWLTLDENWQTINVKNVQVPGKLENVAIEPPHTLTVICPSVPKFLHDSGEPIESESPPKYEWTQTDEDVTITKEVPGTTKADITVDLTESNLCVTVKEDLVLNGKLFASAEQPTWTLENDKFELVLQKVEEGLLWEQVVSGDSGGKQVQTVRNDPGDDQPFNAEELEDVDVAGQSAVFRLDLNSRQVTHEVDLSTLQFLFSSIVDPYKSPAISLRHLNDACLWQLEGTQETPWKPTHIGTFSAFGYVQASKVERKFIEAPPDLSYAVIADAYRHLYVFRQPSPVDGTLRNRTSGVRVKAVAKQQLINLQVSDEYLGVRATNNHLLVLTKSKIFVMVIKG